MSDFQNFLKILSAVFLSFVEFPEHYKDPIWIKMFAPRANF